MVVLFRNYLVIFISFLSSAALAVGPKPTLSEASSHADPRVPAPFLNTGSRFRPYPQLSSSSSSSPRVPQGFNALFTAIAMVQSAPGQVTSAFLPHHVVPLPPLSPRPNRMAISELLLPDSTVPSSSSHAPRSEEEAPASSSHASMSEEEAPASSLQEISAPQQGENEARFALSAPDLEESVIAARLEELSDTLAAPKEGQSVRLLLHSDYLPRVVAVINRFSTPSSFPPITLELYQFQMCVKEKEKKRIAYDMGPLIRFLKVISPRLTEISFIDSDISESNMDYLYKSMLERESTLLENIVKFEFKKMPMALSTFTCFLKFISHLHKLNHLVLDIKCKKKETFENLSSIVALKAAMNTFVCNKHIQNLKLLGDFFDGQMMEYFIDVLINSIKVKSKNVEWQELNILETGISQDRIISLLENIALHSKFLGKLRILYVPDASSSSNFFELKLKLHEERQGLKISTEI